MAELGVGYISIIPETSKIAPGISNALNSVEAPAAAAGKGIGGKLSSGIKTAMVGAGAAIGVSAAGAIGTAMTKGFARLNAIDQAQAKLKGLGNDTESVAAIMDNALRSVKGTAFGLGEAATTAASMVAAGVKPGEELAKRLITVADTAAIAGASMADVGLIFGSVAARGKLQGDDMMQLLGRGVPVLQLLSEQTGKTSAEVSAMVSKGQIDFATFADAMEKGVGGSAKKMGETVSGALSNFGAALGRLGAEAMKPVFAGLPAMVGGATALVDVLTDAVKPLAIQVGMVLTPAMAEFGDTLENTVAPWLKHVVEGLPGFWQQLKDSGALDALVDGFKSFGGSITGLLPNIISIGKTMAEAAANVSAATWKSLGKILESLAPVIETIVNTLAAHPDLVAGFITAWLGAKAIGNITPPFENVLGVITKIGKVLLVAKVAQELSLIATAAETTSPALAGFARMGSRLAKAFNPFHQVATLALKPMKALATGATFMGRAFLQAAPGIIATLGPFIAIAAIAAAVGAALWAFFTKTETGRELWAKFTDALKASWQWLKDVFAGVWEDVKAKWEPVWEWIQNTVANLWGNITEIFGNIKGAVGELWAVFTGKGDGESTFLDNLLGPDTAAALMDAVATIGDAFRSVWGWLETNIPKIHDWITEHVGNAWDWLKGKFDDLKTWYDDNLKQPIDDTKKDIETGWNYIKEKVINEIIDHMDQIKAVFDAATTAISFVWNNMKNNLELVWNVLSATVFAALKVVIDALVGQFHVFSKLITGDFEGAKQAMTDTFNRIKADVFDAFNSILDAFKDYFGDSIEIVKNHFGGFLDYVKDIPTKIKNMFNGAGTWLVQMGKDLIQGLVNGIKAMGSKVTSAVKSVLPGHAQGLVPGFAFGGMVPGFATGGGYRLPLAGPGTHTTDGFLAVNRAGMPIARLDAGEWVINGESSQKYARELQMINAGTFPKLPGFADGGFIAKTSDEIKKALESVASPYIFGGWSEAGVDCSGAISLAVNVFRGLDKFDSRTATAAEGAWLVNKGFSEGRGGEGDFRVAFLNGGPGGGHTAAQLPDGTFVESGGNTGQGLTIGGKAGPLEGRGFTDWYYAKGAEQVADALHETASAVSAASGSSTVSTASSSSSGSNFGKAQELFDHAAKHLGLKSENASGVGVSNAGDPLLSDENRDAALGSWNGPDWGPEFFAHEIARSAKDAGLGVAAAIIGVATTLVESGNPLKMWANNAVPESLSFRHDAVGSDSDSIGLFQQRQAGWGTVEDRMTPFKSAGMFFDRLKQFDWENMDPGAAAQKVQVSAFPDRYAQKLDEAKALVARAGVYDTGGVLPHGVTALNLSHKPEVIINNDQLTAFSRLSNNLGALVPVLERATFGGDFRGGEAVGLNKDDPIVDAALQLNKQLRSVGGSWVDAAQIVQDAENGLAQTRKTIAADLSSIKAKEAEVAELRKQVAELEADEGGLSVQSRRKIQDAEEALANARAKGKADAIANAEKRLARAREDADAQLDKSDAKNAKKLRDTLKKLNKAEDELANTRKRSEDTAKRLEAAERTVIASRFKAIQGAIDDVFKGIAQAFTSIAAMWQTMGDVAKLAQTARQEASKLQMQQVTDNIARLKAYQDLRLAEWDVFKARMDGLVSISQAEHAVEEARIAATMRAGSSLNALGGAIDRFRDTGVFRISEITDEMVDSSEEVTQANAALARVRAEALLAEEIAHNKQVEASFAAANAALAQAHTAQMLQAATARMQAQAQEFYGLTAQGASRAQRGFGGIGKIVGGIGKILGGIAGGIAGFAVGGPLGAIAGGATAISGLKDLVTGSIETHAYRDDIRDGWKAMGIGDKVGLIAGLGIQGVGAGAAGYLSQSNPAAAAAALQASDTVGGIAVNTKWDAAKLKAERAQSLYEEAAARLDYDLATQKAQLAARQAAAQLEANAKVAGLQAGVEFAKLQESILKASTKDEAQRLADAANVAAAKRDEMLEAARAQRAQLAEIAGDVRTVTAKVGSTVVELPLIKGDSYSADQVESILSMVNDAQSSLELRVKQLEKKDTPAVTYMAARR